MSLNLNKDNRSTGMGRILLTAAALATLVYVIQLIYRHNHPMVQPVEDPKQGNIYEQGIAQGACTWEMHQHHVDYPNGCLNCNVAMNQAKQVTSVEVTKIGENNDGQCLDAPVYKMNEDDEDDSE